VRLDNAGLQALEQLGHVRHIVRLGAFHGMDDEFYLRRYRDARFWALPSMTHSHTVTTTDLLTTGEPGPFAWLRVFTFDTAIHPESALLVDAKGGILVTCDSLQNWTAPDEFFDSESARRMAEGGFFYAGNPGPGFLAGSQPNPSDFKRLLELPFCHLLSAHGTPLLHVAHATVTARLKALSLL
jgi:hypothetical protein